MNTLLQTSGKPTCSMSPLLAIVNMSTSVAVYSKGIEELQWSGERHRVAAAIRSDGSDDDQHLDAIQGQGTSYVLAHRNDLALCDLVDSTRVFKNQQRMWQFEFQITRTDFIPSIEIGFSGTSADKLAELRARRILLNESPARETTDINEITRELFLGGHDTIMRIKGSAFPELYARFGKDPIHFLNIAWIQAVISLKLAGCVATVGHLELALHGSVLEVWFKGTRHKRYVNAPPYEINIEGACALGIPPGA